MIAAKRVLASVAGRIQLMAAMADVHLTLPQVWQGLGAVALLGAGFGALQAGLVGGAIRNGWVYGREPCGAQDQSPPPRSGD